MARVRTLAVGFLLLVAVVAPVVSAATATIDPVKTQASGDGAFRIEVTVTANGSIGSDSRINTTIDGQMVGSMIPDAGVNVEEVWLELEPWIEPGTHQMTVSVDLERGYSTAKTVDVYVGDTPTATATASDSPTPNATATATATPTAESAPAGGGGIVVSDGGGAPGPLGWPEYGVGAVVLGGAYAAGKRR